MQVRLELQHTAHHSVDEPSLGVALVYMHGHYDRDINGHAYGRAGEGELQLERSLATWHPHQEAAHDVGTSEGELECERERPPYESRNPYGQHGASGSVTAEDEAYKGDPQPSYTANRFQASAAASSASPSGPNDGRFGSRAYRRPSTSGSSVAGDGSTAAGPSGAGTWPSPVRAVNNAGSPRSPALARAASTNSRSLGPAGAAAGGARSSWDGQSSPRTHRALASSGQGNLGNASGNSGNGGAGGGGGRDGVTGAPVGSGPWRRTLTQGAGSHFVREVGGSYGGYLVSSGGGSAVGQQQGQAGEAQPFFALTFHPNSATARQAVACGSYKLTLEFKCSESAAGTGSGPEAPDPASDPPAAGFHLLLSWSPSTEPGCGPRYTAITADCCNRRWSVEQGEFVTSGGSWGWQVEELASAHDGSLEAGCFHSLSLEVRKGAFLTLHCDGRTLFTHAPVMAAHTPLALGAADGGGGGGGRCSPMCGPLGLAVSGSRLDFKSWTLTSMTASASGPGAGSAVSPVPSANSGRDGQATSSSPLQQQAPPAPPGGAAAAARDAFRGVSAAAAAATAVSATAYANTRWTRKPHVADTDPHLVEAILSEVVRPEQLGGITFDDIASLDRAKRTLNEAVALPLILPEFFTGIREPWRGVLLYGPPGTGKTLLARAVAAQAEVTFFAVSSATMTSKWRGDSEKLVRTLFAVAAHYAPAIIFIDEMDALATSRDMESEHDASRRFKAELLQQMDGLTTGGAMPGPSRPGRPGSSLAAKGVMVLAATNCPWDLDAAMRRRLEKRIYVPLPDEGARYTLFVLHLRGVALAADVDLELLAARTPGYSGADIRTICRDAALAPMRRLLEGRTPGEIRRLRAAGHLMDPARLAVCQDDLLEALANTAPSCNAKQTARYEEWAREFGAT